MAGADVTVTGGSNNGSVDLGFNISDAAYANAQVLAAAIDAAFSTQASQLSTGPVTPNGGLVISPASQVGSTETLSGFGAIVVQNTTGANTIYGGGVDGTQSVLASTGGLTFFAKSGLTEDQSTIFLTAIGGNNYISFAGNDGISTTFLSGGNDTVIGGDALTNVQAGGGDNSIVGGSGDLSVQIDGTDTVQLGSGQSTVYVDPADPSASVVVEGASVSSVTDAYSLIFFGGTSASTVEGGAGSYLIAAGPGGGDFTGGSAGGNNIYGSNLPASTETVENLITQSEAFDNPVWVPFVYSGNVPVVTPNVGPGPNGVGDTADEVTMTSIDSGLYYQIGVTGTYTFSVWVKLVSGDGNFALNYYDSTSNTNTSQTVLADGTWQQVSLTFTGDGNSADNIALIHTDTQGNTGTFEFWGAQLNAGSTPGPYVATTGTAISETVPVYASMSITGGGNGDFLSGGAGNDTINAGPGTGLIVSGGAGNNSIIAGPGSIVIGVEGTDTIQLGTGLAQVFVDSSSPTISAVVQGATEAPTVTGYSLQFYGGSNASTVLGGLGSYYINAGSGGGVFTGGSGGDNDIFGTGSGSMTITGGGNGDYLQGGTGNDTIFLGNGDSVIAAGGGGDDSLIAGSQYDIIGVDGTDTVQLGTGLSQIFVSSASPTISALVQGSLTTPTAPGYSLEFYGGSNASTVLGGPGRYYINASTGGGVFTGGSVGQNDIFGTGAMTITGGGYGDYLQAGDSGNNLITAGAGNEILSAGQGAATLVGNSDTTLSDDFSFANISTTVAQNYVIDAFHIGDLLHFADTATGNTAVANYSVSNGSGTTSLSDGTQIVLQGYAGSINNSIG